MNYNIGIIPTIKNVNVKQHIGDLNKSLESVKSYEKNIEEEIQQYQHQVKQEIKRRETIQKRRETMQKKRETIFKKQKQSEEDEVQINGLLTIQAVTEKCIGTVQNVNEQNIRIIQNVNDQNIGTMQIGTAKNIGTIQNVMLKSAATQAEIETRMSLRTPKKTYFNQGMSFILRIFFLHVIELSVRLKQVIANRRKIAFEDIPLMTSEEEVEYHSKLLQQKLQERYDQKKPLTVFHMIFIIFSIFRMEFISSLLFLALDLASKLLSSMVLEQTIIYVTDDNKPLALCYGLGLCIIQMLQVFFGHNQFYYSLQLSSKLKMSLVTTVFAKVNSLSAYSIKQAELSKIVNIISNDMNIIEMKFAFILMVILAPFCLVISAWILISRHGPFGILMIVLLFMCLPIQNALQEQASSYTSDKNKYSDERIKLTGEIIDGIRLIKMYAWEEAFIKFVQVLRKNEMRCLIKQSIFNYIGQTVPFASMIISCVVPFTLMHYFGEPGNLCSAKIFASLSIIMFFGIQVMLYMGIGFSFLHEFKILLERFISIINVKDYSMINLDLEPLEIDTINSDESTQSTPLFSQKSLQQNKNQKQEFDQQLFVEDSQKEVFIKMKHFSVWWNIKGNGTPSLKNLCLDLKKGKLIGILGLVGSGKSSFLYSLIGEMPAYRGIFEMKGSVSFSKQEPYIFAGTIKTNILFGKPYNQKWYDQVCKACCLLSDFEQFCDGDETEIGEKGINLSGGQKARISLARAVYANADIILLDDPLSAVDSKVSKNLVKYAFKGLLSNKLVILVTHQIAMAKHFDHIVILDQGKIRAQGTFKQCQAQLSYLSAGQVKEQEYQQMTLTQYTKVEVKQQQEQQIIQEQIQEQEQQQEQEQVQEQVQLYEEELQQIKDTKTQKSILFAKEDDEDLAVQLSTYKRFFQSSPNKFVFPFILFLFVVSEIIFSTYNRILTLYDDESLQKDYFFLSLGITGIVFIFCLFAKYILIGIAVIKTSTNIHDQMINRILRSPVLFYDRTSSGVILNRFSNDVGIMDYMLHFTFIDSIEGPLNFLNLLITVAFIAPYFLIIGFFEILLLYQWLRFNKDLIMQTKSLDLLSKSPVFSYFSSTLAGMEIVRVFNQNSNFYSQLCEYANNNIRCSMTFWSITRLYGFHTQFVTSVCSIIGIFIVIIFFDGQPGLIGQCIIYLILMTEYIQWSMRQIICMDSSMSSTQRAFILCDLEMEKPFVKPEDNKLIKSRWPKSGQLILNNVHMMYRKDLDYTLKGLSFEVQSGQKIGIVGRTGAGKSSIIECLFRMREGENENLMDKDGNEIQQQIIFDGQEIHSLGLHTLRNQISIIPQTPFVFFGTIRRNLDPLDTYSDQEIINALKETNLFEMINKLKKGIYTNMNDVSSIFSVGQKQLICLARAILKKSKFIIMDEATANMDMVTDAFIQRTIKEKFDNSTVLTIAHRLNTIADYDKVIVMDKGKNVEFESPFLLLVKDQNDQEITQDGIFANLVKNTGEQNSKAIFNMAKEHYFQTNSSEF